MEEKQILDFVHRISHDNGLREEWLHNPEVIVAREVFSSDVAKALSKLIPYLNVHQTNTINDTTDNGWA